ncbi:hypothetical protein PR048_003403 [Dryococelus australis]|uniref:Regulatory protein zeste n=1 Tax=Dryococelus australis TaxID=614101 RepID=A0ABQ9IPZ1_9NEOP|nr:hypothetical protein PR048_003403 [Dryococelus australis]
MSFSESMDEDVDSKKFADRALFVKLLCERPVLLQKSRVPKIMNEKKLAWDDVVTEYSHATGMKATHAQMSKTFQNMKNRVKTKTDTKTTGYKNIKLKEWEKGVLLLLGAADNPIFTKVQGSVAIGGPKANRERERYPVHDYWMSATDPLQPHITGT